MRKTLLFGAAFLLYLCLWPVPLSPLKWTPPVAPGYAAPFEVNTRLNATGTWPLKDFTGPEDAVWDGDEHLYLSTHQGTILRLRLRDGEVEPWVKTGGAPLGLAFHPNGDLIVADAIVGLLAISPRKQITVLLSEFNGVPLGFTDGVAVAKDGEIYFTDASMKFGVTPNRNPLEASQLDLLEHGPNGRVLRYSPSTGTTTELQTGLYFPNGVAISEDQSSLFIAETGLYRVLRIPLDAPRSAPTPIRSNLPGFPDNIRTGREGRLWVGMVTPRNSLLDLLGPAPLLRSITLRLPRFLRPGPASYAHVIALDGSGSVLENLHGDQTALAFVTGAVETPAGLFLTSLRSKELHYLASPELTPAHPGLR